MEEEHGYCIFCIIEVYFIIDQEINIKCKTITSYSGNTAVPSFRRVHFRNWGTILSGYEWLEFSIICSPAVPRFPLFAEYSFGTAVLSRYWWLEFPICSSAIPRFSPIAQGTVSELRHQSRTGSSSLPVFKGTDPVLLKNWKVYSVLFRYRMGTDTVLKFLLGYQRSQLSRWTLKFAWYSRITPTINAKIQEVGTGKIPSFQIAYSPFIFLYFLRL